MLEDVVATVADFASGLGLEAAKRHFDEKMDEKKLKNALKEYIERQDNYNEIAAINEDIDFQGLVEYIEKIFFDNVT